MDITLALQLLVQGILLGGIYGLIAMGLSLIFGVMGVINFAHGQMLVMGMYVSYWIFVLLGIDPYVSLIVVAAVLFVLGYVIQASVVNRILDYPEAMQVLPLVSMGLILENTALLFWGPDHRSPQTALSLYTYWVGPVMIDISRLIAFVLAILITVAIFVFLKKTNSGKRIRAASDNRTGAILVGINVDRINNVSCGIGAAATGAAGALLLPLMPLSPHIGHDFTLTAALVILLILPLFLDKYVLGIFIMIFYYAYVGQSWNVLTGYTGHISLGHALYIGIGAYVTTYLAQTFGLTPWIGMLVGGIVAVLFALSLGYLGFRFGLRGVYFVIMTIAFAEITRLVVSHIEALGSFSGIFLDFNPSFWNFQFRGNLPYYYISLGFMVASLMAVRLIETSKVGRFIVAIREDEDAAQALGVNTFKYNMIAIAISAFMTALAGAFYANYIYYLHPNTLFGMSLSIELILRPIIGGLGTLFGPVIGSFILTPLSEISRAYFAKGGLEGLHLILYGVLTILVVLFMPKGIIVYVKRFLNPILKFEKLK